MKTLNPTEYSNLPEEQKRFWKPLMGYSPTESYIWAYGELTISLEQAEKALEEAITPVVGGYNPISTYNEALTKLKESAE